MADSGELPFLGLKRNLGPSPTRGVAKTVGTRIRRTASRQRCLDAGGECVKDKAGELVDLLDTLHYQSKEAVLLAAEPPSCSTGSTEGSSEASCSSNSLSCSPPRPENVESDVEEDAPMDRYRADAVRALSAAKASLRRAEREIKSSPKPLAQAPGREGSAPQMARVETFSPERYALQLLHGKEERPCSEGEYGMEVEELLKPKRRGSPQKRGKKIAELSDGEVMLEFRQTLNEFVNETLKSGKNWSDAPGENDVDEGRRSALEAAVRIQGLTTSTASSLLPYSLTFGARERFLSPAAPPASPANPAPPSEDTVRKQEEKDKALAQNVAQCTAELISTHLLAQQTALAKELKLQKITVAESSGAPVDSPARAAELAAASSKETVLLQGMDRQRRLLEHLIQLHHEKNLESRMSAPPARAPSPLSVVVQPEARSSSTPSVTTRLTRTKGETITNRWTSALARPPAPSGSPLVPPAVPEVSKSWRPSHSPAPASQDPVPPAFASEPPLSQSERVFYEKELTRVASLLSSQVKEEETKRKLERRAFLQVLERQWKFLQEHHEESVRLWRRETKQIVAQQAQQVQQLMANHKADWDRQTRAQSRREEKLIAGTAAVVSDKIHKTLDEKEKKRERMLKSRTPHPFAGIAELPQRRSASVPEHRRARAGKKPHKEPSLDRRSSSMKYTHDSSDLQRSESVKGPSRLRTAIALDRSETSEDSDVVPLGQMDSTLLLSRSQSVPPPRPTKRSAKRASAAPKRKAPVASPYARKQPPPLQRTKQRSVTPASTISTLPKRGGAFLTPVVKRFAVDLGEDLDDGDDFGEGKSSPLAPGVQVFSSKKVHRLVSGPGEAYPGLPAVVSRRPAQRASQKRPPSAIKSSSRPPRASSWASSSAMVYEPRAFTIGGRRGARQVAPTGKAGGESEAADVDALLAGRPYRMFLMEETSPLNEDQTNFSTVPSFATLDRVPSLNASVDSLVSHSSAWGVLPKVEQRLKFGFTQVTGFTSGSGSGFADGKISEVGSHMASGVVGMPMVVLGPKENAKEARQAAPSYAIRQHAGGQEGLGEESHSVPIQWGRVQSYAFHTEERHHVPFARWVEPLEPLVVHKPLRDAAAPVDTMNIEVPAGVADMTYFGREAVTSARPLHYGKVWEESCRLSEALVTLKKEIFEVLHSSEGRQHREYAMEGESRGLDMPHPANKESEEAIDFVFLPQHPLLPPSDAVAGAGWRSVVRVPRYVLERVPSVKTSMDRAFAVQRRLLLLLDQENGVPVPRKFLEEDAYATSPPKGVEERTSWMDSFMYIKDTSQRATQRNDKLYLKHPTAEPTKMVRVDDVSKEVVLGQVLRAAQKKVVSEWLVEELCGSAEKVAEHKGEEDTVSGSFIERKKPKEGDSTGFPALPEVDTTRMVEKELCTAVELLFEQLHKKVDQSEAAHSPPQDVALKEQHLDEEGKAMSPAEPSLDGKPELMLGDEPRAVTTVAEAKEPPMPSETAEMPADPLPQAVVRTQEEPRREAESIVPQPTRESALPPPPLTPSSPVVGSVASPPTPPPPHLVVRVPAHPDRQWVEDEQKASPPVSRPPPEAVAPVPDSPPSHRGAAERDTAADVPPSIASEESHVVSSVRVGEPAAVTYGVLPPSRLEVVVELSPAMQAALERSARPPPPVVVEVASPVPDAAPRAESTASSGMKLWWLQWCTDAVFAEEDRRREAVVGSEAASREALHLSFATARAACQPVAVPSLVQREAVDPPPSHASRTTATSLQTFGVEPVRLGPASAPSEVVATPARGIQLNQLLGAATPTSHYTPQAEVERTPAQFKGGDPEGGMDVVTRFIMNWLDVFGEGEAQSPQDPALEQALPQPSAEEALPKVVYVDDLLPATSSTAVRAAYEESSLYFPLVRVEDVGHSPYPRPAYVYMGGANGYTQSGLAREWWQPGEEGLRGILKNEPVRPLQSQPFHEMAGGRSGGLTAPRYPVVSLGCYKPSSETTSTTVTTPSSATTCSMPKTPRREARPSTTASRRQPPDLFPHQRHHEYYTSTPQWMEGPPVAQITGNASPEFGRSLALLSAVPPGTRTPLHAFEELTPLSRPKDRPKPALKKMADFFKRRNLEVEEEPQEAEQLLQQTATTRYTMQESIRGVEESPIPLARSGGTHWGSLPPSAATTQTSVEPFRLLDSRAFPPLRREPTVSLGEWGSRTKLSAANDTVTLEDARETPVQHEERPVGQNKLEHPKPVDPIANFFSRWAP